LAFLLADEPCEIERLELGQRAGAVAFGERTPFDADVRQRGGFRGTERGDLLWREQRDLVGLYLLREAHALPRAHAVEIDVTSQREIGEQQQNDEGSHPRSSRVRES